jgi:hypothetical protein
MGGRPAGVEASEAAAIEEKRGGKNHRNVYLDG